MCASIIHHHKHTPVIAISGGDGDERRYNQKQTVTVGDGGEKVTWEEVDREMMIGEKYLKVVSATTNSSC